MLSSLLAATLMLQTAPATQPAFDPPAALQLTNVPPIAKTMTQQIERYTGFRGASATSWHPTKRELLISTRFANTSQAHRLERPMGFRQQITFLPENVRGMSYNPKRDDYAIFGMDEGGSEFVQIYRIDFPSRNITRLTDGKSKNDINTWSDDGTLLAYTSTRRNGADNDIYLIDPTKPESDTLLKEVKGGGWGVDSISADNDRLIIGEYLSVEKSRLYLLTRSTGEMKLLTPDDGNVVYGGGEFAADGKSIFTITDRDSDVRYLAKIDLATGKLERVSKPIDWEVGSFSLSRDKTKIALLINEAGRNKLELMKADGSALPLPPLPAGDIGGVLWSPSGDELALNVSSAKSPSEVFTVGLNSSAKMEQWTVAEGPIDTGTFVEPQLVEWTSFDGLKISGWLHQPDPKKFPGKRPVIINIHGGPEGQSRPGFGGALNYYTNELGVAVIFPNIRGSTGFGKKFVSLDNGVLRENSVKDIGALLDWIEKQNNLDPKRVMTTGGSYGGYMAYACAVHFSDRLRASASAVGISNFITFLNNTQSYRRDLRRVEYGDERDPEIYKFFEAISPLNNATKIKIPMLISQGLNDPRVPASEAEQMVSKLKGQGNEVWYVLANNEGHGFAKKENSDFFFYTQVEFVKKTLLKE